MEVANVQGTPTDTYSKLAKGGSDLKLIIIPGNPGVVDFYTLFVDTLFDNFDQKCDVIAIAHVGHTGTPVDNKIFSVEEQIQHKIDFLEKIADENKNTKFVLIGHSVGAYIALKVMKRGAHLNIVNIINLFPTIKRLWQGLAPVVKVLILPGVRNAVSAIVHYAPRSVTNSIISYVSTLSDEARYVVANKINYHLLMNVLYMAHCEGMQILEIDDECHDVLTKYSQNMYFLYSTTDQYTPREFYDEMCTLYPKGNFEMVGNGIKHAFVLKNSVEVANKVSDFLYLRREQ